MAESARPSFVLSPRRAEEVRAAATAAGWHESCPDATCHHAEACAGRLRSHGDALRGLPTCLRIAVRMASDPGSCTVREAEAWLGFLRPGAGWTLGPVPPGRDGWEALGRTLPDDEPMSDADCHLVAAAVLGLRTEAGRA